MSEALTLCAKESTNTCAYSPFSPQTYRGGEPVKTVPNPLWGNAHGAIKNRGEEHSGGVGRIRKRSLAAVQSFDAAQRLQLSAKFQLNEHKNQIGSHNLELTNSGSFFLFLLLLFLPCSHSIATRFPSARG